MVSKTVVSGTFNAICKPRTIKTGEKCYKLAYCKCLIMHQGLLFKNRHLKGCYSRGVFIQEGSLFLKSEICQHFCGD